MTSIPSIAVAHEPSRSRGHVDLQHRVGARREVVDRAGGDDLSAVDDDRSLAEVLDEVELVRREQHRRPAPGLGDEHLGQRVDGDRVEPGERLVEHQDVGLVDQRADQLHPLLVAEREVLELVAGAIGEAQLGQPARGLGLGVRPR